jgi:hypothetical protein
MAPFRLRFPASEIPALAARFDVADEVEDEVAAAGAAARARGFYTKAELVRLCAWKTPRSRPRVAQNTEGFVEGITRAVFATGDEAERMAGLCALRGVEAPTASVLLHFAFPDRYPIIDWRALESLGQSERARLRRGVPGDRRAGGRVAARPRQGAVAVLERTQRYGATPVNAAAVP